MAKTKPRWLKLALPQPSDAISVKYRFVADDRHVFRLTLSDQHSVEWVLVEARQKAGANAMLRGNLQRLKSFLLYFVTGNSLRVQQLSGNLPS